MPITDTFASLFAKLITALEAVNMREDALGSRVSLLFCITQFVLHAREGAPRR